jgi:hypothetical protein
VKVRKNSKAKRLSFLLVFFVGFQLLGAHPFYVSICEMDYKSETKTLEISLRIFTDDLEQTIKDWSNKKPYLGETNEIASADSLIKTYIFQILSIDVNEKEAKFEFLGKDVEQELIWIYLEAKNILDFNKITISNRLLFQSYPNQTNLIHVNHRQKTKSLLLTKNNPSDELSWRKN